MGTEVGLLGRALHPSRPRLVIILVGLTLLTLAPGVLLRVVVEEHHLLSLVRYDGFWPGRKQGLELRDGLDSQLLGEVDAELQDEPALLERVAVLGHPLVEDALYVGVLNHLAWQHGQHEFAVVERRHRLLEAAQRLHQLEIEPQQ